MTELVSVIIPTYNRAEFVCQAIESALQQVIPDGSVEVIVVDDGSTDSTAELVDGMGKAVKLVRQSNQREGAARNNGARLAAGSYLAFLDSDDYWLPGKLAGDIQRMRLADAPALVYSRAVNVDPAGRTIGSRHLPTPQGDVFWTLARESFVPLSSVTVRAEVFRQCHGFVDDAALSGTADWELWLRIAARFRVGFAEQRLTCVRVHPPNPIRAPSMLADPSYMERAMLAGVRYALQDEGVAARARGRSAEIRSHMFVTIALNAYRNGLTARAAWWLVRAVFAWPRQLLDRRFAGASARVVLGAGSVGRLRAVAGDRKLRRWRTPNVHA